jgi:streptogramin lyase
MDGPPHPAVKAWGGRGVSGCCGLTRLASLAPKRRSRTAEFRIASTSGRDSQRLHRSGSARVILDACVGVLVMALFSGTARAQFFEMHAVSSAGRVYGITAGPDGNVWFTDAYGKIGKMTSSGVVTMYEVPLQKSSPTGITLGPDGNLWFADSFDWIGRITTSGVITMFGPVSQGGAPRGIAAGPDGKLWFTEYSANRIGAITTSGEITEFEIPGGYYEPLFLSVGPDGAIWFTTESRHIGRFSMTAPREPVVSLQPSRRTRTVSPRP